MQLFWQLAISLMVAVISAVLTVKLAFRRFLAERWWERKAGAYASVLKALHVMKRGLEDDLDRFTDANRRTDEEYNKEQLKKYRAARDQVYEAVDTGSFLLATQATDLLQKLENDLARAERNNLHDGHYFDVIGAIQDETNAVCACLDVLPAIARRDLRIPIDHPKSAQDAAIHPETQTTDRPN